MQGKGADGSFCEPDVQQASSTLINIRHTCDYLSSIWTPMVELVVLHCQHICISLKIAKNNNNNNNKKFTWVIMGIELSTPLCVLLPRHTLTWKMDSKFIRVTNFRTLLTFHWPDLEHLHELAVYIWVNFWPFQNLCLFVQYSAVHCGWVGEDMELEDVKISLNLD